MKKRNIGAQFKVTHYEAGSMLTDSIFNLSLFNWHNNTKSSENHELKDSVK